MKTTLKQLQNLQACEAGIDWFKGQKNKDSKHILLKLVQEKRFSWANWYVTQLFTHRQAIQYSIYLVELALEEFEKWYPDDKRPRQAIEVAKYCLKYPTAENRATAWSAAGFVWSVSSTVWSVNADVWSKNIHKAIQILGL